MELEQATKEFAAMLQRNSEAICPCCARRARINRLRIHSTLALMLGRLYYISNREWGEPQSWVHIEAFKPKHRTGNDFSIVKHWGLAEPKSAAPGEDKASSGMWRLTDAGVLWIEAATNTRVPKYAFVMDDRVLGFSPELVTLKEALNNKFSFAELKTHLDGGVYAQN